MTSHEFEFEPQPIAIIPASGWHFAYAYPTDDGDLIMEQVEIVAWAAMAGTQYLEAMISVDGCPPSIPAAVWAKMPLGFVGCCAPGHGGSPISMESDAEVLLKQVRSLDPSAAWPESCEQELVKLSNYPSLRPQL